MGRSETGAGFDGAAAVTRSLLGYGVVAGAFYLTVGVVLALTREGFSFADHPLSVLMLGEGGWMQRANLVLSGLMVVAAAVGIARALRGSPHARRAGTWLVVHGAALVLSGVFAPDPVAGFPPGTAVGDEASLTGVLHLAFGALGFVAIAAAAVVLAGWLAATSAKRWARASRATAGVIVVAFVAGAALATQPVGIALLWLAVVAGWAWLAAASIVTYRTVPHPDLHRRQQPNPA